VSDLPKFQQQKAHIYVFYPTIFINAVMARTFYKKFACLCGG
jgi:hypothetical protein